MMKAQQFVHMASETKSLSHSRGWVPSKPLMSPFKIRLKDAWEVLKGSAEAVTFGNLEDVDTAARMDDQQERSGTD